MSDVRTLSVRLRPEAYGELEERAHAEGRTLAGYARDRLFGEAVPSSALDELREELRRDLAELKELIEGLRQNGS